MKITVYGSGYVGLVIAACFAEVGHDVVCMDVNAAKIEKLKQGIIPIYEPGLEEVVKNTQQAKHLLFTTDVELAAKHGECQFIAVGTPPDKDGNADLSYVLAVAQNIAAYMSAYTVVINKSTVPLGTAAKVREVISQGLAHRNCDIAFDVVSNPEFLKEGAALKDFREPDRVVIGVASKTAEEKLRALYAPFSHEAHRMIVMDIASAELTKYAANAMLATKISFMNQIAQLAEKVGADVEQVRQGIGADIRIGTHFTHAGCGYGGSCFGKDIQALIHTCLMHNSPADIIQAVEKINQSQKRFLFEKMMTYYHADIVGKTFAIWGLAFKPETDDMRDAPSLVMIDALLENGAKVQVYDPKAMHEAQTFIGKRKEIAYCDNQYDALKGAQALVIMTEWQQFRHPDFDKVKA
ncbi:MAG: UDP-glucose/GDP-mannose dehydrogenase family protein, partial [Proteobacteria bacterium]|nr:UDP-glucose/GDP-mannose dehydrogenase family protein [Pseudomonadota bacterium]